VCGGSGAHPIIRLLPTQEYAEPALWTQSMTVELTFCRSVPLIVASLATPMVRISHHSQHIASELVVPRRKLEALPNVGYEALEGMCRAVSRLLLCHCWACASAAGAECDGGVLQGYGEAVRRHCCGVMAMLIVRM